MTPQQQQQQQKTPYIVIGIIAGIVAVFGVSALTLQSGLWTFIGLLVALIVASFLGLAAYRFFISSWLKFADMKVKQAGEQHQHERLMFELQYKYNPPALPTMHATAEREWKPELEKWRWTGVEYVALTIDKLGRESNKLISANKAQAEDGWSSAGRVQSALDFLTGNNLAYVVTKGDRQEGTVIQDGMNAGELMAILSPARLRGIK